MTAFTDHSDLTVMSEVSRVNSFRPTSTRFGIVQSFWASPERASTSMVTETLEIDFTGEYRVNLIQLDLAKYPHIMRIEYFNEDESNWLPLPEKGGAPIVRYMHDCVPAKIPPKSSIRGRQHPQHSFLGHWQTEQIPVESIVISRFRVLLTRQAANNTPLDFFGNPIDYSIAVRNLSVGFEITSVEDVPRTLPQPDIDHGSYGATFATGDDVVASNMSFALRKLTPDRVLLDNAEDVFWRCEPQPDPNTVVCFYADMRGPDGKPQVIDRIFLDPVNTGAHVALYYAQQAPRTVFLSPDKALPKAKPDATAGVVVDKFGMHLGPSDSIILDNTDFNFDAQLPYWVGVVLATHYGPGDGPHTLLECDGWKLIIDDTNLTLQTSNGDLATFAITYQSLDPITVVISYDGSQYGLWARNSQGEVDIQLNAAPHPDAVTKIAIGSSLDRSSFANADILSFVIKEELPSFDGNAYADDPRLFTQMDIYTKNEPMTSSVNGILRFDPATELISPDYPWAIFGGTPSKYSAMEWTPISRNYTAQHGWMEVPPTLASYWKLEFTHLQPTYSDVFIPGPVQVMRFPPQVIAEYQLRLATATPPALPGDIAHQQVAGYPNYDDIPIVVGTGGTDAGFTNTEVFIADDPAAADRLYRQRGENWNYQEHVARQTAPRFTSTQVHFYETEIVVRTSKVAYQVGLRQLKFARANYNAQFDTPQYEDLLYDTNSLDPVTTWVYDDGHRALTSGASESAQILSRNYLSNRDVKAVQFAAQQSPPRQMLSDAEFEDPIVEDWTAVGDAEIGDPVESLAFFQLVPVIRTLGSGKWGQIQPRYLTWGGIETAGATFADLMASNTPLVSDANGNGIQSSTVATPRGGYVYAAARVVAAEDINEPLWVQIVDSVTNDILAEEEARPRKGQITEWFTTYEVGVANVQVNSLTWGDLAGATHYQSFLDTFQRADATALGRMTSGQGWDVGEHWNGTAGASLHIASNLAVVTVAGQRSVVDTTTPWGSLIVQVGAMATGATAELLDLGGLVLMNNGTLIDPNTGFVLTTLTLANDDTLQFDFKPTSQVAPAHSSGADASVLSWSVEITRNSTFVTTVSLPTAFSSTRGIAGDVGQEFQSFAWTPNNIALPGGPIVFQSPVPRDGSLNGGGTVWTQASDGRVWFVSGTFNVVDSGVVQRMAAPAGQSFQFETDIGSLYGALTFKFVPSGTTPANSYYAAVLDDGADSRLYLRADGALVQETPSLGPVVLLAGAVTSFSGPTTILMVPTSVLSSAFIAAHSLSTSLNQTLVFLNGNAVLSTYQANDLWLTSVRGVLGTDGSTISGIEWAPDLGATSSGAGGTRTWGQVTGNGTRTYADVATQTNILVNNPVMARVVQKGFSQDTWNMDSLALFIDPIVWEFSNDDGVSWIPASTIRNNPRGVVQFSTNGGKANQLRYRVTAYARDSWLANLVVRPWYTGHMRDVPARPPTPHGPNLNPLDTYAPVEEDPHFMVWSIPIPREWWFAFHSLLPGITPPKPQYPMITERTVL